MKEKIDSKELSGIVKNVRQLSAYIDDAYLKSEDDRYGYLLSKFSLFHHQIEGLYKHWFPKAKTYPDAEIVNQIYVRKPIKLTT